MKIGGVAHRTIWVEPDGWSVGIIDQTRLPHAFVTLTLRRAEDAARAISDMEVRGAPLIGATAAYGMALAARADAGDEALESADRLLAAARPTAVNLRWALDRMRDALRNQLPAERPRLPMRRRRRSRKRMCGPTGPSARRGCRSSSAPRRQSTARRRSIF